MRRVGSWCGRLTASVPAIAVLVGAGPFPAEPALAEPVSTITTSQLPTSAVVGSSIADEATVTGSDFTPTGSVAFDLYNNSSASGTPLFSDNDPLFNGEATSASYTTTATGTDYWLATYSGDANYSAVTSGDTLEPVIITPASPASVPEPSSLTAFGFALGATTIAAWMRMRRA